MLIFVGGIQYADTVLCSIFHMDELADLVAGPVISDSSFLEGLPDDPVDAAVFICAVPIEGTIPQAGVFQVVEFRELLNPSTKSQR